MVDLDQSTRCEDDYLEARDGETAGGGGVRCGCPRAVGVRSILVCEPVLDFVFVVCAVCYVCPLCVG